MVNEPGNVEKTLNNWYDFRFKIVLEGILIGIFTGLIVVAYRVLLEKALSFGKWMYGIQIDNPYIIPIWIIAMLMLAIIVAYLIRWEPMASGSGIPQVEGILIGHMSANWVKVIIIKFLGGVLSIVGGLAVGREGPSIQLGASVGQGFSRVCKRLKLEEKYLITAGASAGLSAAFNAPLSGAIFALEEIHKSFSPIVLTSALGASITADFVSKQFFGMRPVFDFSIAKMLPFKYYGYLIILGIIIGLMGVLFNTTLLSTLNMYDKFKFFNGLKKMIPAFMFSIIVGLTYPNALGGGHGLVEILADGNMTLKLMVILVIVRFIFTMISYGSGAPGGIFLPLLVVGALLGGIFGTLLNSILGVPNEFIINFIILAMAGYLTAIVKAPITSIILITEMTGSFSHLLSSAIVCIVAYETTELLKLKPVYESLLHRMLSKQGEKFDSEEHNKVLLEIPVVIGSVLDGNMIKDIKWPSKCLIVSIKRGNEEIIPKGNTEIFIGDYVVALTTEQNSPSVNEELHELTNNNV